MKRQKTRQRPRMTRKWLLLAGLLLIGLLVTGNGIVWAVFRGRTYPRTSLMGHAIGSVSYGELGQKVLSLHLLPQELVLIHDRQQVRVPRADLGITEDITRTTNSATRQRSWLPMLNLFRPVTLQAPANIETAKLRLKAADLAKTVRRDAKNAHLTLAGTKVEIAEARAGYELQQAKLPGVILEHLDKGQTTVRVPVTVTRARLQADSLKAQQAALKKQLATSVTYRYGNKAKQVPAADVASWFVPTQEVYELASDKIETYVEGVGKEFGIRVKDAGEVTARTSQAVTNHTTLDLTLMHQPVAKTYLYCTAIKGVASSYLPAFRNKLQSTLNDSRSWSLDGLVEFKEVASGCDFTVWLSAAELMPSFGGVCDSQWSCRSGANVVVNFTRWQNASPAWNAAGGALDEYRSMVINHETGHWLSFGHLHCSGPGQPAPVMQQQSIDLEGCTFSAWPSSGELAMLRSRLGL